MSNQQSLQIPDEVIEFSSVITKDVSKLMKNVLSDLIGLKNVVIDEYLDERESEIHDLGLIISKVGKYTELKGQIKDDSEKIINKIHQNWCATLEVLRKAMLDEVNKRIEEFTLSPSDFTGNELVSVINNRELSSQSSQKQRYSTSSIKIHTSSPSEKSNGRTPAEQQSSLYPSLDIFPESSGSKLTKRKRSTVANSSPSEYSGQTKKLRKSVVLAAASIIPQGIRSPSGEKITLFTPVYPTSDEQISSSPKRGRRGRPSQVSGRGRYAKSPTPPLTQSSEDSSSNSASSQDQESESPSPPIVRTRKSVARSTPVVKDAAAGKRKQRKLSESPVSLEPDNTYTTAWNQVTWYQLNSLPAKSDIPEMPAVYQIKVKQAKKSAYIGVCQNLRHVLMKYKNCESSGQKQLDKFIERNHDNVEIQSLVCSSMDVANAKHKNQLSVFRENFQKNPAFNV